MPLIKKKDRSKVFGLAILAFLAVGFFGIPGYVDPFLADLFGQAGFGDDDVDDSIEVYVKITTRLRLALSTSDLTVNMYDASGEFIDTVTTSSGIGTFTGLYNPGEYVWLQARQAAPASADPYVTPLSKWVVPSAGESADTVSLKNVDTGESILWLRDVTGTAPTLVVRNGFDNDTVSTTTTVHSFNTTDGGFKATLTLLDDDTYYGAQSFTDMINGKTYEGGVWLVLKSNNTHSFTDYDYIISDTQYNYYIWKMAETLEYDSNGNVALRAATLSVAMASGVYYTADSSMVFDAYDLLEMHNGLPLSNSDFIDGGAVAVTAVTTVVQ
jgi:hypothetical protein